MQTQLQTSSCDDSSSSSSSNSNSEEDSEFYTTFGMSSSSSSSSETEPGEIEQPEYSVEVSIPSVILNQEQHHLKRQIITV